MRLKGPIFPSYLNQTGERPSRMQWKAHCGQRARMRNMRHRAHRYVTSNDPEVVAEIARVREATKDEPLAEFGFLHLLCAAVDASEQTGETWVTCIRYFMDKFDAAARGDDPNEAPNAAD